MTDGPYNTSGVLYRKALASAESARAIASGEKPVTVNPKAREADACIVAIVLAHAAVESAWHWEQILAGVDPHEWPGDFDKALAEIAKARGRPTPPGFDTDLRERLPRLSAWRNFLLHGDPEARARLQGSGGDPPEGLTAALATEVVDTAGAVLAYIAGATGGQNMSAGPLWIDPCET